MSTEWLAQLKEGDAVITINGSGRRGVDTVSRTTRTQVLLTQTDRRFRLSDGGEVGGGTWTAWQISQAAPEEVAAVREEGRRRNLAFKYNHSVDWSRYPLSVLEQVSAVLESHSNADKEQP